MNKMSFSEVYKKNKVTITLEFPEMPDESAESDFVNLLKGIYLEKVEAEVQRDTYYE